MSELGARFRQAREGQGLSLAQASMDTRILQQSLIALEEGAFQRLPGDVTIRGFIRNYAQYLGLVPDEMIELYRHERGGTDPIRVLPLAKPSRKRSYVLPSFFGVFFVTVALIGLTYIALNAVGRIGDHATVAQVEPVVVSTPSPLPVMPTAALPTSPPVPPVMIIPPVAGGAAVDPDAPRPAATAVPPVSRPGGAGVSSPEVPTPTSSAPIALEVVIPSVRGNENSWVRVQTDGNVAFEGIMRAGERLSFTAQRRVLVRAGNPPDVLVTVNGLQQGPLGQVAGQPVNWAWPSN
ncbi:helix-turn-helix domain-containing protein [Candidatus Chloroploca sp. M-50]|uniref:Helix-turn-helix domain-containing protein n=1 Tax=Candidatus Chloroploca mongolica TaxID=2528176 RepID=A0ABS4DGT5_9CHLR|nr:RodZ domain-containing protein [Candidatus Chloroploca mongolica]MBP1468656.1 helix-turn-helix domain-containing protein [Candidatus Chloroploca mongolica]